MRNSWIAAVVALALLGGCNSADQGGSASGQKAAAPAIAPGTSISGTVTLHDQIPIGAGAKLDVKLVDVAQPEIPVAEKNIDVTGQPPFTFTLDFDPGKIVAGRTYVINTMLFDGPRRFMPALNSPVLTHGTGTTAQVVLNAEATPGEKLKEEFAKLQGRIGAMKTVNGTYTTDSSSIGWDAFAEGGNVRFVRINTEQDAGGRSAVYYAFKDGKPMAVKQRGGVAVGWGDNGEVLWNERPGGGTVSDGEIKSLRDASLNALQMAQAKVDASKKK